jgi:hypothetical protein
VYDLYRCLSTRVPALATLLLACGPGGRVCERDVVLRTQTEVNAFDCSEITGDLSVGAVSGSPDPIGDRFSDVHSTASAHCLRRDGPVRSWLRPEPVVGYTCRTEMLANS